MIWVIPNLRNAVMSHRPSCETRDSQDIFTILKLRRQVWYTMLRALQVTVLLLFYFTTPADLKVKQVWPKTHGNLQTGMSGLISEINKTGVSPCVRTRLFHVCGEVCDHRMLQIICLNMTESQGKFQAVNVCIKML